MHIYAQNTHRGIYTKKILFSRFPNGDVIILFERKKYYFQCSCATELHCQALARIHIPIRKLWPCLTRIALLIVIPGMKFNFEFLDSGLCPLSQCHVHLCARREMKCRCGCGWKMSACIDSLSSPIDFYSHSGYILARVTNGTISRGVRNFLSLFGTKGYYRNQEASIYLHELLGGAKQRKQMREIRGRMRRASHL